MRRAYTVENSLLESWSTILLRVRPFPENISGPWSLTFFLYIYTNTYTAFLATFYRYCSKQTMQRCGYWFDTGSRRLTVGYMCQGLAKGTLWERLKEIVSLNCAYCVTIGCVLLWTVLIQTCTGGMYHTDLYYIFPVFIILDTCIYMYCCCRWCYSESREIKIIHTYTVH